MSTGWLAATWAVARRPHLWSTALAATWVMRSRRDGRSAQPYLRFRMTTQYGDADHRPAAADVVEYLEWLRRWRGGIR